MIDQTLAYVGIIPGEIKQLRLRLSQDACAGKSRTEEGCAEVDVDVDSDRVLDERFPFRGGSDEGQFGWLICLELGRRTQVDG